MKTPEQLAEEHGTGIDLCCGTSDIIIAAEAGFLAGYQAAVNSPEKQDSCEHILDMKKMVDVNSSNNSNGWISVKERLPEDISDVLILSKEKESCVGYYRSSDNDWNMYNPCCSFHMELHGVTHWMPLPKPPEEK